MLALVRRGKREDAITILMKVYGQTITAFILRILRNQEAAKDVRQQVFMEAFQGLADFQGRSSCYTWLTKIAYHRSIDYLKRERKNASTESFDVLNSLHWQPEPGMDVGALATRRALEQCLEKLSAPLRSEVLMRLHLGLSYVEMEEIVGVAAGTIQVRLSRVLPRLRQCLRGKGVWR